MNPFTKDEVLIIHRKLINRYGGILGFDKDTLEVCLFQPFQSYGGNEIYSSDLHKICMQAYLFIKKHPFKDGNKRVDMVLLILALRQNRYRFELSNDKVIELGLKLADNTWGINELIDIVKNQQK